MTDTTPTPIVRSETIIMVGDTVFYSLPAMVEQIREMLVSWDYLRDHTGTDFDKGYAEGGHDMLDFILDSEEVIRLDHMTGN